MSSDTLRALRQTRVDYQDEVAWGAFLLDAYAGTGGFAGKIKPNAISTLGWAAIAYNERLAVASNDSGGRYLDQYPREDAAKYGRRRQIAHYQNYCAAISDLHLSYVLAAPFQRQLPEKVQAWAQDVDGRGTPMSRLIKEVLGKRAAIVGWCPCILEMPEAPEGMSQAQASELGVKPVIVPLLPPNILHWSVGRDGALQWVKVRVDEVRQDDPLAAEQKVEVYKIYRRDVVDIFEVIDNQIVSERRGIPHGFSGVPFVAFRHKPAFDQQVRGCSMIADSAIASKRLFNLVSELDEHFRAQVFAILQVPVPDGQERPGELTTGTDNALPVPANATQGYEFIAPPASVAEAYESRIKATVREIYRRARTRYDTDTGRDASGDSKAWDFADTNALLTDFAEQIALAEAKVYQLVAPVLGASGDISVTPPDDFAIEDLMDELENAREALGLDLGPSASMQIKSRVVERYLKTLRPEDREQILDELRSRSRDDLASDSEEDEIRRARAE